MLWVLIQHRGVPSVEISGLFTRDMEVCWAFVPAEEHLVPHQPRAVKRSDTLTLSLLIACVCCFLCL